MHRPKNPLKTARPKPRANVASVTIPAAGATSTAAMAIAVAGASAIRGAEEAEAIVHNVEATAIAAAEAGGATSVRASFPNRRKECA
jgi:hypothetical protein